MLNLVLLFFSLKLVSAEKIADDSLIGANELLYNLLKPFEIDPLPIDSVHFKVLSDDVLGDDGSEFKEKAKVDKFLKIHIS